MTDAPTKYCRRCGETKPLTEFHKYNAASDGVQRWCKVCMRAHRRRTYAANREREITRQMAYTKRKREQRRQSLPTE